MTVAYQGAEGAFSHEACLRFLPDHEAIPFATFSDVVAAVQAGEAALGMLPLVNNEAGETGARALIDKARLRIVEEPVLKVRMHLLGLPDATLDQIRTVVSHPVALRQCSEALAKLNLNTEETSNTALAAQARAAGGFQHLLAGGLKVFDVLDARGIRQLLFQHLLELRFALRERQPPTVAAIEIKQIKGMKLKTR